MSTRSFPKIANPIKAKAMALGQIVSSSDRRFIIPLNQRPWVWKNKRDVLDFLTDYERTLNAYFDPKSSPNWKIRRSPLKQSPHFFGTLVLYNNEEGSNEFEIFDGQQRLIAVFMLCSVLREIADTIKDQPGLHRQRAIDIYGEFNKWLYISILDSLPRLRPNSDYNDLFEALIFKPRDESGRQSSSEELLVETEKRKTATRLRNSYRYIQKHIEEKIEAYSPEDVTNFLVASYRVLSNLFICVEMTINDEQYSYEVFGCLNARGERLSQADILKNDLFIGTHGSTHKKISNLWYKISNNVPNQDIGEFLRRRYIALEGECPKDEIYKKVKEHEIDKSKRESKIEDLVKRWHSDSRLVHQITEPNRNIFNKEISSRLNAIFNILNIGLAYIPLLAAAKTFLPENKRDFQECVRFIEVFVFRTSTIQGADTPEIERKLGEAARKIMDYKSIHELEKFIKNQLDDVAFQEAFDIHTERRVKVQFYIIYELEKFLLGGDSGVIPGDHSKGGNTIEHILPRTLAPSKSRLHEWAWARKTPQERHESGESGKSEKHRSLINRLGNLLILEHDINKSISNREFSVKQVGIDNYENDKTEATKCYQNSSLMWPRCLANQGDWDQWTEQEIIDRQKQMAKDALKVWKI